MRVFAHITLALVVGTCCGAGAVESVKGFIGDTDLTFRAHTIEANQSIHLPVKLADAELVRVREIYPDTPKQPTYTYDILIGGRLVLRREHTGTGFGPVSAMVRVPVWARKSDGVCVVNKGGTIRIAGVDPVSRKELDAIERSDSFGLFGVVLQAHGQEKAKAWADELAAKMPSKPGIYRGFALEVPYARWDHDMLDKQIAANLSWAKEHSLALMPLFVSWWSGTPMGIPDGEGGTFGDIKYQQVCWTPDSTVDEAPGLRALLGDRWDPRYCLSVPNEWSNTPWLTMNSPALNAYRHRKLDEVLRMFSGHWKGSGVPISGLCLENEPRYWDSVCDAGNPKRKIKTLWADFNPLAVADAAKAGVKLDPSDGLDTRERTWLQRNVARYNQMAVDQARKTLRSVEPSLGDRVFTHSLQLVGFPGEEICHPMSEWAYANGALTGLEGIWMKLSDLDRVREWGPWANINREETDGVDIKIHLWDLRITYARGGRLYNTYNWQAVGPDRVFGYMKEFVDALPTADVADPQLIQTQSGSVGFHSAMEVQAVNRIVATVDLPKPVSGALFARVMGENPRRELGFARAEGPFAAGRHYVEFTFAEPFELPHTDLAFFDLECEDRAATEITNVEQIRLHLDLRRERTQSLWITAHAK